MARQTPWTRHLAFQVEPAYNFVIMPRFLILALLPLLGSCPPEAAYHINLTVTVPPEVQSAFSAASPGLILTGGVLLGQLCDPTDVPFSISIRMSRTGHCDQELAPSSQSAFVIRLSASDLEWFNSNQPDLRCGKTMAITDSHVADSVWTRAGMEQWRPDGSQTTAVGSAGQCATDGDYSASITLQLKQ